MEDVLAQADFVSIHTPLTPETHHLMNRDRFALMKPNAILINTSRGPVVDSDALLSALQSGQISGAALDVTEPEPLPADSPLANHPRVILTPHAAFYSVEAEPELRRKAAQNIVTWARTGRPDYPVVHGTRKP